MSGWSLNSPSGDLEWAVERAAGGWEIIFAFVDPDGNRFGSRVAGHAPTEQQASTEAHRLALAEQQRNGGRVAPR